MNLTQQYRYYEQNIPQHYHGYTQLDEASWARYLLQLIICYSATHTPPTTNQQEWETRFTHQILTRVFNVEENMLIENDDTLYQHVSKTAADFARVFITTSPFIRRVRAASVKGQVCADIRVAWANVKRVVLRLLDQARVVKQSDSFVLTSPTRFARQVNEIVFPVQVMHPSLMHHQRLGRVKDE